MSQFIPYRSSGEKLIKYQANSSCLIMSVILMTTLFYKTLILQGEIWCWSLLGLKRVKDDVTRDNSQRRFLAQHNVATLFREQLQHCSNIATLCSAKNRRCKSFRVTSPKSEEENEALFESCRAFEVAKARISGPVNFVLYRYTGFQGESIHLLINRWSQLSPANKGRAFRPGFETVSKHQAPHAQQRSYAIHAGSFSSTSKWSTWIRWPKFRVTSTTFKDFKPFGCHGFFSFSSRN